MTVVIVPTPTHLAETSGALPLTATTSVYAPGDAEPVGALLRDLLAPATGLPLPPTGTPGPDTVALLVDAGRTDLGAEGYTLSVTPDGARAVAATADGLRAAVQTMRQLLPPEAYAPTRVSDVDWTLPGVEITDRPRFAWRGTMLDVGRWYHPVEFLHRFVDLAAMHKLNTVHLHLTEDQGWRFESAAYPRLTEIGAWRAESPAGHQKEERGDGTPHGGFYTRAQLRELVEFAAARGIRLVPEIDMPGHMRAAIAAYPELGNFPERDVTVATTWGIHPQVLNVSDATLDFCRTILDEVLDVFPAEFVHIGGDECPKTEWRESPAAQQRMRDEGLATEDELQSWFVRQLGAHLADRGRRMVGWDEILEGGLAPGATVMSWRGETGGVEAARAGHDVVMAPNDRVYFDYYQGDPATEPLAIGGLVTLDSVARYEPVPAGLTAADAPHVLGAQCQLWTEYMPTPRHVEYMAYPRTAAFADAVWAADRDPDAFLSALPAHLARLDAAGVARHP
ncbi:beta-N-acetylhexosaminidase [Actinocatenispora rupis]|uniref:beta-N-acetylhexosaminidase n=1 Tax=Actinocatenispora rupis TaxID=519421 RepID=A0A8J3JJG5_9ACTN|nr:beta-N-acetylhexosaminidase [Actinocatenispora rupis]GID16098.1 beta-N-acetylhexosaminidase [Actinocatenispora rupis]